MRASVDRLPMRSPHVLSPEEASAPPRLSTRRLVIGLVLTAMVVLGALVLNGRRDGSSAPTSSAEAGSGYLVRSGDTSASVAYLHGVSTEQFLEANDLTLSDSLDPGSRLTIPELSTDGRSPPRELLSDPAKLTYEPYFDETTERHGLPPGLLEALAWKESEWVNALVSEDGRVGIGQLRPEIVTFLRRDVVPEPLDPRNAEDNVTLTGAYLAHLLDVSEGDQAGALAGYYLGFETAAPGVWELDVVEFVREVLSSAPDFAGTARADPTVGAGDTAPAG